jgi:hypothetical protein
MAKRLIVAVLGTVTLGASFAAFAGLEAHYLGLSRDGGEFRIYLHGGAYLGRSGSLQSVAVTVHETRRRRPMRSLQGCVYHFDDRDRSRDRIECAANTAGPLRGVVYAREHGKAGSTADADAVEPMVCVQRCSPQAPQRLRLEESDEDNG